MSIKIDSKIVGFQVQSESAQTKATEEQVSEPVQLELDAGAAPDQTIVQLHEKVARPEMLIGSTYKVKTPLSDHALYVTINDIVLNPDTPYEKRRPFEIFINSKNMDHFQWIVALTRIISAVFRKGGDVTFLVEELRSVFDPKGGYFKRGGKYMPSLVAEIGDAIESHMKHIGMIKDDSLDESQKQLIEQKRKEFEQRQNPEKEEAAMVDEAHDHAEGDEEESSFPAGSVLCNKCSTKAMVVMDGCLTCLNCGESKCG